MILKYIVPNIVRTIDFKNFSSFKNSFTFRKARDANQKVFAFLFLVILLFIIKINGMLHKCHFSIIIYLVRLHSFENDIFQFNELCPFDKNVHNSEKMGCFPLKLNAYN